MNLHITDFPEYPWKTLDVHKDFSYSFNISPGKKIEEDLFDSSKMKVVSYNENSHVQILAVCDPYGPPFYVRSWKIQCKLPPKTKRFCPLVLK